MNTNRYPRTMCEAFGHYTGTRFEQKASTSAGEAYAVVIISIAAIAFLGCVIV